MNERIPEFGPVKESGEGRKSKAERARARVERVDIREFLKGFSHKDGRFYCGTHNAHEELLPPDITGKIRLGEEDRRGFRGVIFLTDNIEKAIQYAGPGGVVHIVNARAVKYREAASRLIDEKLAGTIDDDTYIALPEDVAVVAQWIKEKKRRRGDPERYDVRYLGKHENREARDA